MSKRPLPAVGAHVCPPYCHRCPDLAWSILPFCYSMAVNGDEYDLAGCCCDPTDVFALSQLELIDTTQVALRHLQDARRFRQVQRNTVLRFVRMVKIMRTASAQDKARAWEQVEAFASALNSELRQPVEFIERAQAELREREREIRTNLFQAGAKRQ